MDAFGTAMEDTMDRLRATLAPLRSSPPQCLLLEGGSPESRMALAVWWAALLNCQHVGDIGSAPSPSVIPAPPPTAGFPHGLHDANAPAARSSAPFEPCLVCEQCSRIGSQSHSDVLAFDGQISNKEDTENPGPVRAFTMDNVRALKGILGDSPHYATKRVVILTGIDHTRAEAANALLKALEEPSPSTVFVLLSPQREQLLPTLVSRSWVLTLPWPHSNAPLPPELAPWDAALSAFLQPPHDPKSGWGWLDRTAVRGGVDAPLAHALIMHCQKMLAHALRVASTPPKATTATLPPALARFFLHLDHSRRATAADVLAEAQEALQATVNPARVLDWMALQLYALHDTPH